MRRLRGTPTTASSYFHRKNLAGSHRQPGGGHCSCVGRGAFLRTAGTDNVFRIVCADVGVSSGDRQLFAAGHLHQQFGKQRSVGRRRHERPSSRFTIRLGHICTACRVTDMDADSRLYLSGQMDGSRLPVGAITTGNGRLRAGRQLGALAHLFRADSMECRRFSRLPCGFSVVGQEHPAVSRASRGRAYSGTPQADEPGADKTRHLPMNYRSATCRRADVASLRRLSSLRRAYARSNRVWYPA